MSKFYYDADVNAAAASRGFDSRAGFNSDSYPFWWRGVDNAVNDVFVGIAEFKKNSLHGGVRL